MAQRQGELFPEPIVAIHPDLTRCEPRLWVRRLMIWEDPEKLIRDIRLRRGLNVIWSPDPGTATATVGRGDGSGHGAGKTLFCRLLRYCLGEDTFANDDLRRSIAEHLNARGWPRLGDLWIEIRRTTGETLSNCVRHSRRRLEVRSIRRRAEK
jgi:hypothetical protein